LDRVNLVTWCLAPRYPGVIVSPFQIFLDLCTSSRLDPSESLPEEDSPLLSYIVNSMRSLEPTFYPKRSRRLAFGVPSCHSSTCHDFGITYSFCFFYLLPASIMDCLPHVLRLPAAPSHSELLYSLEPPTGWHSSRLDPGSSVTFTTSHSTLHRPNNCWIFFHSDYLIFEVVISSPEPIPSA